MDQVNNQWIFVSRPNNNGVSVLKHGRTGLKLASVSLYMDTPILHLRRYYGDGDLKFPTQCGISMSKKGFESLLI